MDDESVLFKLNADKINHNQFFGHFRPLPPCSQTSAEPTPPPPPPPGRPIFFKMKCWLTKELYALKTLFNLYYIFPVLQCVLIAVLFIISCMSNFNSFYQDVYRIL